MRLRVKQTKEKNRKYIAEWWMMIDYWLLKNIVDREQTTSELSLPHELVPDPPCILESNNQTHTVRKNLAAVFGPKVLS